MPDAIQTAIADLQREKRANDPVAEPIIMQNADLQAALAEIESFIGSLALPLAVSSGGTGQTSFLPGGWLYANSINAINSAGGQGVAIVQLNVPSIATTLPISMGGTGTALITAGLLTSNGTGAGSYTSTPIGAGTFTVTDASGAGLGTLGSANYYQVGKLIWIVASGTYPSQSNAANAQMGGNPFTTPIVGGFPTAPMHTTPPGGFMVVIPVMNGAGAFALFNGSTGANQTNGGMSAVAWNFFTVFATA